MRKGKDASSKPPRRGSWKALRTELADARELCADHRRERVRAEEALVKHSERVMALESSLGTVLRCLRLVQERVDRVRGASEGEKYAQREMLARCGLELGLAVNRAVAVLGAVP